MSSRKRLRYACLLLLLAGAAGLAVGGEDRPGGQGQGGPQPEGAGRIQPILVPERILGKDVGQWLKHLEEHEVPKERRLAIYCLGDFGESAQAAVPVLVRESRQTLDPEARRLAVEALGLIGGAATQALPDLLELFKQSQEEEKLRRACSEALARIGPGRAEVRDAILKALRSGTPGSRAAAIDAAVYLLHHQPAEKILSQLEALAREGELAAAASTALRCLGESSTPALIRALEKARAPAAQAAILEALSGLDRRALSARKTVLRLARTGAVAASPREAGEAEGAEGAEGAGGAQAGRAQGPEGAKVGGEARGTEGAGANGEARANEGAGVDREAGTRRAASVREAALRLLAQWDLAEPEHLALYGEALGQPGLSACAEELLIRCGAAAASVLRRPLLEAEERRAEAALRVVSRLGPAALNLLEPLIGLLRSRSPRLVGATLGILNACGPAAAAARQEVARLAEAFAGAASQGKEAERARARALAAQAALTLANLERRPDQAPFASALERHGEEALLEMLRASPDPLVRGEAAALLGRRSRSEAAAAALLKALGDSSRPVRIAAAGALAAGGEGAAVAAEALPVLLDWIGGEEVGQQQAALELIVAGRIRSQELTLALAGLAKQLGPETHPPLARALGLALRVQGEEAVRWLAGGLGDPLPGPRVQAARALETMGESAASALKRLLELAEGDPDEGVAEAALAAVRALGPAARQGLAALARLLAHPSSARRKGAALVLAQIGLDPAAGDRHGVLNALIVCLLDLDEGLARAAHSALVRIGPPALPRLREALEAGGAEGPYWVLRVLARLGADPEAVIPRLMKFTLPGMLPVERGVAAELLEHYAPEHLELIPVLVRVLGDREEFVARAAQRTLRLFGARAVPALEAVLSGPDPRARRRALGLLDELRAGRQVQRPD